jgi:hypothetical protein
MAGALVLALRCVERLRVKFERASSQSAEHIVMSRNSPADFFKQAVGHPVLVRLNTGVDYRGTENSLLVQHVSAGSAEADSQEFWRWWTET